MILCYAYSPALLRPLGGSAPLYTCRCLAEKPVWRMFESASAESSRGCFHRSVVLAGATLPPGTRGDICRHFWLLRRGGGEEGGWHRAGGGQVWG